MPSAEQTPLWSVDIDVSGGSMQVTVTGEAGVTINWEADLTIKTN